MADELRIHERPDLERPILISAFRGWNDGGQGASLAAGYLARLWDAELIADVDPEEFFDFQATRPQVKLEDGLTRQLVWPETAFYRARPEGFDRDIVLLLGVEPNLRWQAFTRLIVDYAADLGVELVVSLGSLLADVPHTQAVPGDRQRHRSRSSSSGSGCRRRATRARRESSGCSTTPVAGRTCPR